jgi:hypothetical protein
LVVGFDPLGRLEVLGPEHAAVADSFAAAARALAWKVGLYAREDGAVADVADGARGGGGRGGGVATVGGERASGSGHVGADGAV